MPTRIDDMVIPDSLPRRGNRLTRAVGRLLLRLGGWRLTGEFPDAPKFVVAAAPHTSNWDGLWAIALFLATGVDFHWMAKKELFALPLLGRLFRWLGGVPVDRQAPRGLVEQVVDQFREREAFLLVITPEGTRRRVERWKTGFYRIAHAAQVPIVLGFVDYPRRLLGIGPTFVPTGEMDREIAAMRAFFAQMTGRHPERM